MYSRFYICKWHLKIGITFLDFKSENLVVQIVLYERPWQSILYSGNKDLWDRFRGLLGLSQFTYIEKILKEFSINLTRKGIIPKVDGKHLSKFMYSKTHEGREIMIESTCFSNWLDHVFYDMYTFRYSSFSCPLDGSRWIEENNTWKIVKNIC